MLSSDYKFFGITSHLAPAYGGFFLLPPRFICGNMRYLHLLANVWRYVIDKYVTYIYCVEMQFGRWYFAINLTSYIKLEVFTAWYNILLLQSRIMNDALFLPGSSFTYKMSLFSLFNKIWKSNKLGGLFIKLVILKLLFTVL